jgi:hypothetical protein
MVKTGLKHNAKLVGTIEHRSTKRLARGLTLKKINLMIYAASNITLFLF